MHPARSVLALLVAAAAGAIVPAPVATQEVPRWSEPRPAWLGIGYEVRWLEHGSRCEPRVVVESVVHGSPAERAGLRPGDAILMVDGQPAPGARLRELAARLSPGDSVRLRFQRGAAVRIVTAVADRRPARPPTGTVTGAGAWLEQTSAPVVRVSGDTLEAWNVEPGTAWDRPGAGGYWIARADGGTEYRRLDAWSRDALDRRVADLLECADRVLPAEAPPAPGQVRVQRIQQRADSLRIVIARRALEAAGNQQRVVVRAAPAAPGRPGAGSRIEELQVAGPDVLFRRVEERAAAGVREVAGADFLPLEPELAEYFRGAGDGLLVLRVEPGSPAQRVGLRAGDVVTSGDGRSVRTLDDLRRVLARPDGAAVELRLVRHGRARTLTLRQH